MGRTNAKRASGVEAPLAQLASLTGSEGRPALDACSSLLLGLALARTLNDFLDLPLEGPSVHSFGPSSLGRGGLARCALQFLAFVCVGYVLRVHLCVISKTQVYRTFHACCFSHRLLKGIFLRKLIWILVALLPLFSQKRPELNDGEMHGDAPYLLEDGWKPLLNGTDLSGWHGDSQAKNDWLTTTGVMWDRLLGPTRLRAVPGPTAGGSMLNGPQGRTVNIVSDSKHGDVEIYLEFMVAKGSNSGVYLQGLYEVQVFDSWGADKPVTSSDCGGIYHRWIHEKGVGGSAPSTNMSRRPGEWQSFYILFRAPRFDASGRKTENAKFIQVIHNGITVQRNVEVDGPTRSGMNHPEAAQNPLMLQGDHGPVAYKNIYIRPLRPVIER